MVPCLVLAQVGLSASVLGSHRCGRGGGEQGAPGREQEQIHLLPWPLHSCQPSLQSSSGQRDAVSETGPPQGGTNTDFTDLYACFCLQSVCLSDDCVSVQCPFHGRIVPRDQEGRPCSQEDRLREEQEERRKREEQPGEEGHTQTHIHPLPI